MKVIISERALDTIDAVAKFVESKNTKGSGGRYALRLKAAIRSLAIPNVQYPIFNHHKFAAQGYSCSHFNDWVIVFKIENNKLLVFEIVHGSLLLT